MEASGPAILVVDDDDLVREAISEALIANGFQVETAATGPEALFKIDDHAFDLVIVDIRLPGGLDGLEMARDARARHPALKCLFTSGNAEPMVCDRELDDFIAKPFGPSQLIGCVWKVLRGNFPQPRLATAP